MIAQSFIHKLKHELSSFSLETVDILNFQNGLEEIASWGMQYFLLLLQSEKIFTNTIDFYSIEEIKKQLQLLPSYEKQLDELLKILIRLRLIISPRESVYQLHKVSDIVLEKLLLDKSSLLARYPSLERNIDFLHILMKHYLLILSGKEIFLNLLFPKGSFDVLVGLYKDNPGARYYNFLTAKFIACLIEQQERTSLNILEIGAGIGSTSEQILPLLKSNINKQYHYTDISSAFLAYGHRQFKQNFDFIEFLRFDINKLPADQKFQKNYYDVILATNVIHNATDMIKTLERIVSLLKAGGILILNEGIAKSDYSTLIYGLSSGWWSFTDVGRRIPGTPLINLSNWQKLFSIMPLGIGCSLNKMLDIADSMGQDVLVAMKKDS